MNKIAEYTYLQLYVVLLIIVLLINLDIMWKYILHLGGLAIIIGIIGAFVLKKTKEEKSILNFNKILVIFLVIFSLGLIFRLVPYFSNQIPLGYDPGIYKYIIEEYGRHLPNIPETELASWITFLYEPGLFVFTDLLKIIGISTQQILTYLFVIFCTIVSMPIYLVTKKYFNRDIAILAAFFYLFSLAQLQTFWFMYYKNIIAIFFLLIGLYFIDDKRIVPLFLTITAIGFFHRPTFLLFTLIFVIYTIVNIKDKKLFFRNCLTFLISCLALIPIYYYRFSDAIVGLATESFSQPGSGTFLNTSQFQFVTLIYLPLAIVGLFYLIKRKEYKSPLLIWFAVNLAIVLFKLVFYNRFLIFFDIILIILASAGLYYSILRNDSLNKWLKIGIISLIVLTSLFNSYQFVSNTRPLITDSQLSVIEWMNNTEDNASLLATSNYYSPWVLGYSGRNVIVPGLFDTDKWNKDQWQEFWSTNNTTYVKEMLSVYPKPLYIHITENQEGINRDKFSDSCFEEVLNANETIIYRYRC